MMPRSLEEEFMKEHYKYRTYEELRAQVYLVIHTRSNGHAPMLQHFEGAADLDEDPEGPILEDEDGQLYRLERAPNGQFRRRPKGKGKGGNGGDGGKGKGAGPKGGCFKCGRDHWMRDCTEKNHKDGGPLHDSRPPPRKVNNVEVGAEEQPDVEFHGLEVDINHMEADEENIERVHKDAPEALALVVWGLLDGCTLYEPIPIPGNC